MKNNGYQPTAKTKNLIPPRGGSSVVNCTRPNHPRPDKPNKQPTSKNVSTLSIQIDTNLDEAKNELNELLEITSKLVSNIKKIEKFKG